MNNFIKIFTLITFCVVIVNSENTNFKVIRENLKFRCTMSGLCVRLKLNETVPNSKEEILYDTQNICRLVCGSFGALWPRPTGNVIITKQFQTIHPDNLNFINGNTTEDVGEYLKTIQHIFLKNIKKECTDSDCNQGSDVNVDVIFSITSDNLKHNWETDESYKLEISPTNENRVNVQIKSETVYGARNGLETLSQLITGIPDPQNLNKLNGLVMVSRAKISDRPIYVHRGVSYDTSRHFFPVKSIEKTLDGMAASKMNIFHWHATDSHSFPLEITRVPQMTKFGAYSKYEIYSRNDIEHIFKYAHERGIRVILEMDAPAHSGNGWQWGQKYNLGDLAVCVNQQPWRDYCIQPPCGQLNPANFNLYSIIRNIFKDFTEIIPKGEAFHMGGDEIFFNCWNSSIQIKKFLIERGLGNDIEDFTQLWAEFQTALLRIWDEETGSTSNDCSRSTDCNSPSKIILWSSHLTDPIRIEKYLDKSRYIIQTWVESSNNLNSYLLNLGYNLIISTKNAWYLDHGFWGVTQYYNWRTVYRNRLPLNPGVLGGEVCLWSEYIDEQTVDSRVWPRAAAAAERLWSDPELDPKYAESRFYRHRQRLVDRGLKPEAIAPQWCLLNEGDCV